MTSLNPLPISRSSVTVFFSHPQISKRLAINTGANQITWDYQLNTRTVPTYGGEVVQVLSAAIGQLQVSGNAASEITLEAIYQWFRQYMEVVTWRKRSQQPAVFEYPLRGWKFAVHIVDAPGMRFAVDTVAPEWTITAEIINSYDKGILQEQTMKEFRPGYIVGLTGDALPRDIGLVADKYSSVTEQQAMNSSFGDNFQRLLASWLTGDYNLQNSFNQFASTSDNGLLDPAQTIYSSAFNGATGIQLSGGSSTLGGTTTGGSATFTAVSDNQNRFCTKLASLTQIDPGTFATVCFAEQGKKDKVTGDRHTRVDPTGDYNFLNVDQIDSGVARGALDPRYVESPESAAEMTNEWIRTKAVDSIKAFLTTMPGKPVEEQVRIWQESPWASNHYNGTLVSVWTNTIMPSRVSSGGSLSITPGRQGIVDAALWAFNHKEKFKYEQVRPIPFGWSESTPTPIKTDCSGLATACYYAAGVPDPNGLSYNGQGYTGSMWPRGAATNNPQPGDLAFYGSQDGGVPSHVAVHIGNGEVISFGHDPITREVVQYRSDYRGSRTYDTTPGART